MKLGVNLGLGTEKRKETCLVFLHLSIVFHFVLFGFYTFNSAGRSWLQSSPLRLRENTGSCANIQPTHEVIMWLYY